MVFSCYSHAFWLRQNFEQNFRFTYIKSIDSKISGLRLRQLQQPTTWLDDGIMTIRLIFQCLHTAHPVAAPVKPNDKWLKTLQLV